MGVRDHRHAPAALLPGKRPGTHCIGGLVGPRAGMGRCGKSCLPPGFDPRTAQPVANRYTDWAIAARCQIMVSIIVPILVYVQAVSGGHCHTPGEFVVLTAMLTERPLAEVERLWRHWRQTNVFLRLHLLCPFFAWCVTRILRRRVLEPIAKPSHAAARMLCEVLGTPRMTAFLELMRVFSPN